jgi:hypothetical protein
MSAHNRRLKFLQLGVGAGESPSGDELEFGCQVQQWKVENNTPDGDKLYSFCFDPAESDEVNAVAGEFREEADPDYVLTFTVYSDWRSAGISTYAWAHDGETVPFRLDHHPNNLDEHCAWLGHVKIKAPSVGGEARSTEMSEMSWVIIGKPTFLAAGEAS